MNMRYLVIFLAASLLTCFRPALADDTDLFVQPNGTGEPPDVLFVIDNAANFDANSTENCVIEGSATAMSGKVGGIEQCALYNVISGLNPGSVNIGIMVYNANGVVDFQGVACVTIVSSKPGGCLVYPMRLMDDTNKASLMAWIRSWKTTGNGAGYIKANSEATGGSMQEAWAYYNGHTGLSGKNYVDAMPPSTCNKYIIFIGNSFNNSGSPGDQTGNAGPQNALNGTNPTSGMNASPAATLIQRTVMTPTLTTTCGTATLGNPHENNGYYADEWSRYMKAHDITTYTIGVLGAGCQADYSGLLKNTAAEGGGKYFETRNTAELVAALNAALSEMIANNSVFASVSLPVTVTTQGFYLNQVFIGMFRPDTNALPRWFGNLKQYRLGRPAGQTSGLELQDARTPAQSAISSSGSGFIAECALSYWTPTVDDAYWGNYLVEDANCIGHSGKSNTPDGNRVEKGGQGYLLRGSPTATFITRNMKTCDASCSSIVNFDTTQTAVITKTKLGDGAMTDQAQTDLINWARGLNNGGDETFVLATAKRPSVHGDVVHSRPVALNYADDVNPQVVVFYGANDGALRAVNGNRATAIGSVAAGAELWSFMPPEYYDKIKRERDNNVTVAYYGNPVTSPAPLPKPYGFDGPVAADVVNGVGGHRWIFASMRRGGRAIYAFDVSNLNTDTSSPTLLWKKGCPNMGDDTGCSTGYTGIGQTWATPQVLRTTGHGPLLLVSGGYDSCEDADPDTCTSSNKGSKIYVMDATDGSALKTFDLSSVNGGHGVVADVFVVTDRNTGLAKWAYAADLDGNVWRISGATANQEFGSSDPATWTITRIAALGCDNGNATCSHRRKFMFSPDVVEKPVGSGIYYILIGSGDREKPLLNYTNAYGTANYFFMVKDQPADPCWIPVTNDGSGNCTGTEPLELSTLAHIDVDTDADVLAAKGWYLDLNPHEQVVTSAITVFGTTTFSTHTPTVPAAGACESDLGTARVYNILFTNAAAKAPNVNRSAEISGGGLPPSPVAGRVRLDDGTIVPFLIGGDPNSPLQGGEPTPTSLNQLPKSITYWFIHK
jgi:type IV pilus assembly protein PilY1